MQTSMKRNESIGQVDGRAGRMVGGVAVLGLVFASATLIFSCAPGNLDCVSLGKLCTDPAMPDDDGGAGTGAAGTGGKAGAGAAGSAGGGGTGGMAGTGGTGVTASAATVVTGCTRFPTLGDMDKFFGMRCGTTSACHGTGAPWSDLKMPDVWKRMLNAAPKLTCVASAKIIDKTTPANSLLLVKAKQATPMCQGGGEAGTQMPPPGNTMMIATPLPADELDCLTAFVNAAAGK